MAVQLNIFEIPNLSKIVIVYHFSMHYNKVQRVLQQGGDKSMVEYPFEVHENSASDIAPVINGTQSQF